MATPKQIAANRQNAVKSTGPRTSTGKSRSRQNAIRHGLSAETVVGVLEDPKEYRRFEAEISLNFRCRPGVDEVLLARLVSLLWRLRRATAIESGLMQIHGTVLKEKMAEARAARSPGLGVIYQLLRSPHSIGGDSPQSEQALGVVDQMDVARCFQRVARLDAEVFDRLGRYEATLWKQVLRILQILSLPTSNR